MLDDGAKALGLQHPEDPVNAEHLAVRLGQMVTEDGVLIVNTYRPHASTRILELFGRKFDYRTKENLTALLATADFGTPRLVGSGNMYDVMVYIKEIPSRIEVRRGIRGGKGFGQSGSIGI